MSFMPGFVYSKEVNEYAQRAQVREKRSREQRLARRCYLLTSALVVLAGVVVMQAGTLRAVVPLTRLIPIILWRHEDSGVIEAAVTPDGLPADMQDGTIKAFLAQYMMWREMYSGPMLDWAHHVVDAMSSVQVADAYDKWVGAKTNPTAYQIVFGPQHAGEPDRCTVFALLDASDPKVVYVPPGAGGSAPGKYVFHFWRKVSCRDEPPHHAVEYTVAIDFIAGYRGQMNVQDLFVFNPARIVVTGYSTPVPVPGAMPKDINP